MVVGDDKKVMNILSVSFPMTVSQWCGVLCEMSVSPLVVSVNFDAKGVKKNRYISTSDDNNNPSDQPVTYRNPLCS